MIRWCRACRRWRRTWATRVPACMDITDGCAGTWQQLHGCMAFVAAPGGPTTRTTHCATRRPTSLQTAASLHPGTGVLRSRGGCPTADHARQVWRPALQAPAAITDGSRVPQYTPCAAMRLLTTAPTYHVFPFQGCRLRCHEGRRGVCICGHRHRRQHQPQPAGCRRVQAGAPHAKR